MIIYIDDDYKCHTDNTDGLYRGFDTAFFDGKCRTYIEGYRYIPAGESWTRSDGVVFFGEMTAPWRDYTLLAEFQAQHEETQRRIAELEAIDADKTEALAIMGVVL